MTFRYMMGAAVVLTVCGCSFHSNLELTPVEINLIAMRRYHQESTKWLPSPDATSERLSFIDLYYLSRGELADGIFVSNAKIIEVKRVHMPHIYGESLDLYAVDITVGAEEQGGVAVNIGGRPAQLEYMEVDGKATYTNRPELEDRKARFASQRTTPYGGTLRYRHTFDATPDTHGRWTVIEPTPAYERDVYRGGVLAGSFAIFATAHKSETAKAHLLR